MALLGGTIIGFEAIKSIGNAIPSLIVISSSLFSVGDRIFFNSQFTDILAIEIISTKMLTLDKVLVSGPYQELPKAEIYNFARAPIDCHGVPFDKGVIMTCTKFS